MCATIDEVFGLAFAAQAAIKEGGRKPEGGEGGCESCIEVESCTWTTIDPIENFLLGFSATSVPCIYDVLKTALLGANFYLC